MTGEETYLLKEFDKLNDEIAKLLEEIRSREKWSLTIIAAISAWMYSAAFNKETETILSREQVLALTQALSWIPLLTTILYGISVWLLYKNIKWIGQYLNRIEKIFLAKYKDEDGLMGWERHFRKENKQKYFVNWTWAFWIAQILVTIFVIYKSYSLT
jgi:hypothetical protein